MSCSKQRVYVSTKVSRNIVLLYSTHNYVPQDQEAEAGSMVSSEMTKKEIGIKKALLFTKREQLGNKYKYVCILSSPEVRWTGVRTERGGGKESSWRTQDAFSFFLFKDMYF